MFGFLIINNYHQKLKLRLSLYLLSSIGSNITTSDDKDYDGQVVFPGHTTMEKMLGPSFWQKYFLWRSRSEEQSDRRVVKEELEKMFGMGAVSILFNNSSYRSL